MASHGLKPWDPDAIDEGLGLIEKMQKSQGLQENEGMSTGHGRAPAREHEANESGEEEDEDEDDEAGMSTVQLHSTPLTLPGAFLNREQKAVVRQYGGWELFLATHGLKPWEPDAIELGLKYIDEMIKHDDAAARDSEDADEGVDEEIDDNSDCESWSCRARH